MRSLYRQSRPPGNRACAGRDAPAVLAAQSGGLSEEAAFSLAAAAAPPGPGDYGGIPRANRAAWAALWRQTDHSGRRARPFPPRPRARAAAANCRLHLEPVARPRLAARPLG